MAANQALRALIVLSQVLLGLMAGFFFAFAVDVAPAMARLDATGYITVQQHINAVVRNATFGGVYFGSAVLPWLVALAAFSLRQRRLAMQWLVLALVYGALVFLLTREMNIPINNFVASLDPAATPADWPGLRDRWNAANELRAWAAAACFGASLWFMRPDAKA